MSGQTLTDRIAAAQYQLTGSDMARAVCKATTHEVMAPKKKHLECKSSFLCPILHGLTLRGLQAYRLQTHPPRTHATTAIRAISSPWHSHFLILLAHEGCGAIMN